MRGQRRPICMGAKRQPKRKNPKQIKVVVHYPNTKEGWELLEKSQATVMIDILENKLGEEKVEELFDYIKKKAKEP